MPHPDAGIHAYIEFGNRLLTFVLVIVAIGTLLAAWRARDAAGAPRPLVRGLAIAIIAGIVAQAVIGGISVLVQLNPWVVGAHLLPSIALIVACVLLVHEAYDRRPVPVATVGAPGGAGAGLLRGRRHAARRRRDRRRAQLGCRRRVRATASTCWRRPGCTRCRCGWWSP